MKYYKVKADFDQFKLDRNGNFLVANELYTKKEVEKIREKYEHANRRVCDFDRMFEVVEISKHKIYWFFGARFAS